MKKGILTALGLSAAMLAASAAFPISASAEAPALTGDVNGDGIIDLSDAITLSKYLLGRIEFDRRQYALADINGDGTADSIDLAGLKYIVLANSGRTPSGTWIASDGVENRYFFFNGENGGSITYENTGGEAPFTLRSEGDSLSFDLSGSLLTARISWINSNMFNLSWSNGKFETFRFYGNDAINYDELLTGEWIGNSSEGQRVYSIKGISGSYLDVASNVGTSFQYEKYGSNIVMHKGGEAEPSNAVITPVDSMHIDISWGDGRTERLTRHEITVVDGITYVNGILIANKTYDLPSTYNPNCILPEAQAAFDEMAADALRDGYNLWICSGFRSYNYQRDLYNSYVNRDGKAKADTYSARPGHSEHQTGLAMDIIMAGSAFDNTPEARWIAANCWKYGFIIRYPQGKQDITGYKYESWHVRYLGRQLAQEVTESGLTLEEFLCIDSVYKY